ncbi:MAG: hypothetical protein RL362_492 [Bacteroidota bacterium]|jgi:hypothetical protein
MRFILFINVLLMSQWAWGQSPQFWEKRGDQERSVSNWSGAFEAYQMAFEMDSSAFERRFKLAEMAYEMRQDTQAIRLFQSLVKMDQGKIHPMSYFYLGLLMQRNARYDEVVFYIKKFKQKAKGKKEFSEELKMAERLSDAAQWSLNQLVVDSIQWRDFAFGTSEGEGQPYWERDSIFYSSWQQSEWTMMKTDSTQKETQSFPDRWNNQPVLHMVAYKDGAWGVARSESGLPVLIHKSTKDTHWELDAAMNVSDAMSSMPFMAEWNGVLYLLFSSNREGGSGGQDIWLSRYGQGEWGKPFNAGVINTAWDEIEPRFIQGQLYFSSNGHLGFGEFDVFKVSGSPGAWGTPVNLGLPINSCKNDIGFDVLKVEDGERWLLGSARKDNGCCQDVFVYHWKRQYKEPVDTVPLVIRRIQQWLPLKLYFHNDEPNPNSWDTLTQLTYTECQISYLDKEPTYLQQFHGDLAAQEDWESFKEVELVKTYNHLQSILVVLENRLILRDTITLIVRGFASPLADGKYNKHLTSRRIESLRNEIKKFRNGALVPYLDSTLFIQAIPYGESNSKKVSDDKKNQKQSVFSSSARLERRIEIEAIEWRSH